MPRALQISGTAVPLASSASASRSLRMICSGEWRMRFIESPPALPGENDSHIGWTSLWGAGQFGCIPSLRFYERRDGFESARFGRSNAPAKSEASPAAAPTSSAFGNASISTTEAKKPPAKKSEGTMMAIREFMGLPDGSGGDIYEAKIAEFLHQAWDVTTGAPAG